MVEESVVRIGREALLLTLVLSLPPIGLSMVVGLLISIFQAATQIQEASLSFLPKLIGVGAALVFFGPWILEKLTGFTVVLLKSTAMVGG